MSPLSTSLCLYLPLSNSLSLIIDRYHCLVQTLIHFIHLHLPQDRQAHYHCHKTHKNGPVDPIRHFGLKIEGFPDSAILFIISMHYMKGTRSLARETETRTFQPIRNNFTVTQG